MPPADGESKQGKERHAVIATDAFKDVISCRILVSGTAAYLGALFPSIL